MHYFHLEQKNQHRQQSEKSTKQQNTAKKLAQTNRDNMPGAESAKEQNMANQAVKQCYTCKGEDHEIKNCKKRRNMLLRYSDSRHTNTREMKEKMDQYGTVISIGNRKSEYEKAKRKYSMFCNRGRSKKSNVRHNKYNYQEGWDAEKTNIHSTEHS